ncbi:glycoside hydrolase [Auriculariales sp. MPI-PUGE-AT-0066]|nr:glycoside hydrolase [Auriculariales sp. MPI-PUGE-AT-0066]
MFRPIVALAALTSIVHAAPTSGKKGFTGKPVVSGYWPSYQASLLRPEDIPYDVYTHIDWFVASTTDSYELNLDGHEEDLKAVVAKAHTAGITVSMSIGGWTGSIYFSDLVANATAREAYAKSMKSYVDLYNLDGIDIDWEYPSAQGIGCNKINVETDSDNFLEFVKVLRETLGPSARISAAVSQFGIKGPTGELYAKFAEFAKYMDYILPMTYDTYGPWSATSGPLGPLRDLCATPEGQGASAEATVKRFTEAGFPANQIVLGLPSYSRALVTESSTLTRTAVNGGSSLLYQNITSELAEGGVTSAPAGVDVCGVQTAAGASWLFNELISTGKLNEDATMGMGDWKRYWDHCSQTPFLFNNVTRNFIPYDDPQSFETKAAFARSNGLAGIMMFDMTGDTRDSKLIRAARRRIIGKDTRVLCVRR